MIFRLLILVSAMSWAPALSAQTVVTPEWLLDRAQDTELVILHVGEKKTFNQGHIPGAQFVNGHMDFSDPSSHSGDSLTLELPSVSALEARLEGLGVSDDSNILVYWSDEELTNTTRVIFTLQWAGLGDRTYYLDGGLDAWKQTGQKTSKTEFKPEPGSLTLIPQDGLVVDADWVQRNINADGIAVLDARSSAYFDGVTESRGKAGHIPGAGSAPWAELVDRDLKLEDPETLRAVFAKAGVAPGDTVVAYCHIGQYATAVLLAARTLGHDIKLYDGAYQDWVARGLPLITE